MCGDTDLSGAGCGSSASPVLRRVRLEWSGRSTHPLPQVYLKTYDSVNEAKQSLAAYIHWYNTQRRHSGINHHKPYEVMTCEKEATTWSFKEPDEYVDNSKQLPHKFTAPTTETIKQQKVKLIINHSSRKAA